MKLTKSKLKRIIKEELQAVLNEQDGPHAFKAPFEYTQAIKTLVPRLTAMQSYDLVPDICRGPKAGCGEIVGLGPGDWEEIPKHVQKEYQLCLDAYARAYGEKAMVSGNDHARSRRCKKKKKLYHKYLMECSKGNKKDHRPCMLKKLKAFYKKHGEILDPDGREADIGKENLRNIMGN